MIPASTTTSTVALTLGSFAARRGCVAVLMSSTRLLLVEFLHHRFSCEPGYVAVGVNADELYLLMEFNGYLNHYWASAIFRVWLVVVLHVTSLPVTS